MPFFVGDMIPMTAHLADIQFAADAAVSGVEMREAPADLIATGIVSQKGTITRSSVCLLALASITGNARAVQDRSLFCSGTLKGSRTTRTGAKEAAGGGLFLEKTHAG